MAVAALPVWADELKRRYVRGESSLFVLHGNVHDKVLHDGKLVGVSDFVATAVLEKKDLVCRFKIKAASFDVGDVEGVVKGNTSDGKPFEGHAPLKVVMPGKKRKHHYDNDRWERHADRR